MAPDHSIDVGYVRGYSYATLWYISILLGFYFLYAPLLPLLLINRFSDALEYFILSISVTGSGSESARTPCTPPGRRSTSPCSSWSSAWSSFSPAIKSFLKRTLCLFSTIQQGELAGFADGVWEKIQLNHLIIIHSYQAVPIDRVTNPTSVAQQIR